MSMGREIEMVDPENPGAMTRRPDINNRCVRVYLEFEDSRPPAYSPRVMDD